MSDYFDRDGNPISQDEWTRLFADKDYQRVALDTVGDLSVSTVWLGLDHSFGSDVPQIFETMIFGSGSWDEEYCERYATREQAIVGHDRALRYAEAQFPSEEKVEEAAKSTEAILKDLGL